ncbi:hypothetical protein AMTRI_Chr01g135980 [Amborella trichopoda]
MSGKVVCVTGASGYIGSWLVKLLLQRGYTVRATVRDINDSKKTKHLFELDGANERLKLFKAENMEDRSFDAAVDGCDGVFHVASPVVFSVKDPQTEIIDPAVKGTLNVLGSCSKFSSIKRVVVTSSMAAVVYNKNPRSPDVVVDETWFSDPTVCKDTQNWYALSKILAEKAAWDFAKEKEIDLVVMNPGLVIGPLLQPNLNSSCAIILNLLNGSPPNENITFNWITVQDVAEAHILAYEVPSASGRYCLVERREHYSKIVKVLHELYPEYPIPQSRWADENPFPPYQVSKEKTQKLGVNFTPIEVGLKETVESLKEKKFL